MSHDAGDVEIRYFGDPELLAESRMPRQLVDGRTRLDNIQARCPDGPTFIREALKTLPPDPHPMERVRIAARAIVAFEMADEEAIRLAGIPKRDPHAP